MVGRLAALADPRLVHPGLVVLLLAHFAPICETDDQGAVVSLLEAAWNTVLPDADECLVTLAIEWRDATRDGFEWQRIGGHWNLVQTKDLRDMRIMAYSLRNAGNDQFPFTAIDEIPSAAAREIGAIVEEVLMDDHASGVRERAVAVIANSSLDRIRALADAVDRSALSGELRRGVVEPRDRWHQGWVIEALATAEPWTLTSKLAEPRRRLRVRYALRLEVPHVHPDDPATIAHGCADAIWEALTSRCTGSVSMVGSRTERVDGTPVRRWSHVEITVIGDLEEGLTVIRDALQGHPLPPDAMLQVVKGLGNRTTLWRNDTDAFATVDPLENRPG
jgi:hypothetical protein